MFRQTIVDHVAQGCIQIRLQVKTDDGTHLTNLVKQHTAMSGEVQ